MNNQPQAHLVFEQSPMPVSAMLVNYPHGHLIEAHTHSCAQLLYAIQGVMIIQAKRGKWVVPPSHGVWIEANMEHTVQMSGDVQMRTVFIKDSASTKLIRKNCVVAIPPLLRELILAATKIPLEYDWNSRDGKLMSLLIDELQELAILPMHLAWPEDERIVQVCTWLSEFPADQTSVAQWAAKVHVSEKTFHRLFSQQTGVTFGRWRQQIRLLLALEKIAHGEKIVSIALELGYESQSAFAAMFKRHFGTTPTSFYS